MAEKPEWQEFEVIRKKTSSNCSKVELTYRSKTKSEDRKEEPSGQKYGTEDLRKFASETTAALVKQLKQLGEDVTEYEGGTEFQLSPTIISLMGDLRKAATGKTKPEESLDLPPLDQQLTGKISEPTECSHETRVRNDRKKKALQTELETQEREGGKPKLDQLRDVVKNLRERLEDAEEKETMPTEKYGDVQVKKEKVAVQQKSTSWPFQQAVSAVGQALLQRFQRSTVGMQQADEAQPKHRIQMVETDAGGKSRDDDHKESRITGTSFEETLAEKVDLDEAQGNLEEIVEKELGKWKMTKGSEKSTGEEHFRTKFTKRGANLNFLTEKLKEKEREVKNLRYTMNTLRRRLRASLNRELDVENGFVDAHAENKRLESQLEVRNRECLTLYEESERVKKDLEKLKEFTNTKLAAKDHNHEVADSQGLIEGFATVNEKLDVVHEVIERIRQELKTLMEETSNLDEEETDLIAAMDEAMGAVQNTKQDLVQKQREIHHRVAEKALEVEHLQLERNSLQEELQTTVEGIKVTHERYGKASEDLQNVQNEKFKLSTQLNGRKLRAEQERDLLKQQRNMLAKQLKLIRKGKGNTVAVAGSFEEQFTEEDITNLPIDLEGVEFPSCSTPVTEGRYSKFRDPLTSTTDKFHSGDNFQTASAGHIDSFHSETNEEPQKQMGRTGALGRNDLAGMKMQLQLTLAQNKRLKKQVEVLKEQLATKGIDYKLAAPQLLDMANQVRKTLENFIRMLEETPPIAVFCNITKPVPVRKDGSQNKTV